FGDGLEIEHKRAAQLRWVLAACRYADRAGAGSYGGKLTSAALNRDLHSGRGRQRALGSQRYGAATDRADQFSAFTRRCIGVLRQHGHAKTSTGDVLPVSLHLQLTHARQITSRSEIKC